MRDAPEDRIGSTKMEDGDLHWSRERQMGGQMGRGDRLSVRSGVSLRGEGLSWTESERELIGEQLRRKGVELETHLVGEEEPVENHLPEKAAQVFSPAVTVLSSPTSPTSPTSPRRTEAFWETGSEHIPFLGPRAAQDYSHGGCQYEWSEDRSPASGGRSCCHRDVLKVGVSLMTSALFFPFLVWGGFVFLPFDAPVLDGAALRLVYTLRCSVFATAPIFLGWIVLGICRLRFSPLSETKGADHQEVSVHWRFVSDSVSLFLLYFLQLVVMAMYLSQEHLKLIPLLTVVFAVGRLVYWVAAVFGSSVRGFGFGLSFLPSLVMMVSNMYFIFMVDAAASIFSLPPPAQQLLAPPTGRQRFWG